MKHALLVAVIGLFSFISAPASAANDPNTCYNITKTMSFFLVGDRTRTNYEVCPVMIPESQKQTALRQWCVQLKFGDFVPRHMHCPVEVVDNGGVIRAQAPAASDNNNDRDDRDNHDIASVDTNEDTDTGSEETASDTGDTGSEDTASDTSSDTGDTGGEETASDTSSDAGDAGGEETASDTSSDAGDAGVVF